MPLTGKDVWEAIVKLGLMSGPYDPRTNRYAANADRIGGSAQRRAGRTGMELAAEIQAEDAMQA